MTTEDRERRLVLILACVQFTHIMDFMVLMPLGPQLMRVMGIGPREFSFLVVAYTGSAAVASFLTAMFIDRFDRKRALVFLYTGFALATLLCGMASGYGQLLAGRLLAGAFGGVCGAAVFAVIGDAVPPARRGAATGTVSTAFSFSAIAGVPVGLFLASLFGWRAPFVSLVAIALLILAGIVRYVPSMHGHLDASGRHTSAFDRLKSILREPNHRWALALPATMVFGGFSVIPFLSPYAVANVGLLETDLPWIYFFGGLATAFTSRRIGRICDQRGKRETFAIVAALSIVPVLLLTNFPPAPVWAMVACTTLFMIFVSGRTVPAMALVTASAQPRVRGGLMSLNASLQHLSSGLASLSAGMIVGRSESGALTHYWVVGLIAVATTVLAVGISRRIKSVS
jgi:predicted MFS family arabinose efflux permease